MAKTPIPPPTIQLVERDGSMSQPWYDYFLDMDRFTVLRAYVVASLPPAATSIGMVAYVTNATATTQNSIVAGGGANKVIVFSDGTNWRIA